MIKVYDINGSANTYDADSFVESGDGVLYVNKGDVAVSVYARGQWINADVVESE